MTVTWVTVDEVLDFLGTDTVAPDDPWLIRCTEGANEWARRKRVEAGYAIDTDDITPGPDASTAVQLYAGALFRARGSAEGFASFEDFVDTAPGSLGAGWTQIKRLLGIPRPVAV